MRLDAFRTLIVKHRTDRGRRFCDGRGGTMSDIPERVRQVMNEINASSPGYSLAQVPTLFAFGPIDRALREVQQEAQAEVARLTTENEGLRLDVAAAMKDRDDAQAETARLRAAMW